MTDAPAPDKTKAPALAVAEDFLSAMMPEILRSLPDWTDFMEGRWPVASK